MSGYPKHRRGRLRVALALWIAAGFIGAAVAWALAPGHALRWQPGIICSASIGAAGHAPATLAKPAARAARQIRNAGWDVFPEPTLPPEASVPICRADTAKATRARNSIPSAAASPRGPPPVTSRSN